MEEQKLRADTPDSEGGGYFTLSESETGSSNGTDSKDESLTQSCTSLKKQNINTKQRQKSQDRSGSETPPRPSLPKGYKKEITPPRPNPPRTNNKSDINKRKSLT